MSVKVELPASGEAVSAMGREAMQALAARVLTDEYEPVPDLYLLSEGQ